MKGTPLRKNITTTKQNRYSWKVMNTGIMYHLSKKLNNLI